MLFYLKVKQSNTQKELEKSLATKEIELADAIESGRQAVEVADASGKQTQDKLLDLNKQLDNAVSERLELDAKVESASDELRCVNCICT